ncbi:MAG: hypothetical protein H8D78_13525 [Chloroflexi bacterium]|nr:hypothetical protein [Chloroflexota bacterium]
MLSTKVWISSELSSSSSQDSFPRATLADFLGDFVVYRNLEPADGRLRGLKHIWPEIGLAAYRIPRKAEPEYADAILHFLRQTQALRGVAQPLKRLLYIGDTRLLDGTAYRHLRAASGWPGWGFIASEDAAAAPSFQIEGDLYLANRWTALTDFLDFVQKQGIALDEATAAVIDLDKTALGARGRNHRAVDAARVDGVQRTVGETLGADFDETAFRVVYDELNQPRYHHFTADNQDVLAYVCLMVAGGVYDYAKLLEDIGFGRMLGFEQFIKACHEALGQRGQSSAALRSVHTEVYDNFRRGDPTPFKSFRRQEYLTTIGRMDFLPDDTELDVLLREEITLTGEVKEAAHWLQARGVLCFGISDKPDEASRPTPAQAEEGYPALHRAQMKVVGKAPAPPPSG